MGRPLLVDFMYILFLAKGKERPVIKDESMG
jgi:hypothetical protein